MRKQKKATGRRRRVASKSKQAKRGRRFTAEQRDLYEIVLGAQIAACAKVSAGKEYREIHLETCAPRSITVRASLTC